jgi:broad specificity phosphatase PhoE
MFESRYSGEWTMRLILVRHGQSVGNVEQRIQGKDDPLTDFGRRQAAAAGEALAARGDITHLYASPLARAFETASTIGRAIGMQPDPLEGFAEIDPGDASGLLWTEWAEMFPAQAAAIQSATRSPFEQWAGGESGQDLADRVFSAWDELVTRHLGTRDVVTLVSHGGPLAWIAARLHDDPLDVWPAARANFRNCSISELLFDADGSHTVICWNQTGHLDDVLQE